MYFSTRQTLSPSAVDFSLFAWFTDNKSPNLIIVKFNILEIYGVRDDKVLFLN